MRSLRLRHRKFHHLGHKIPQLSPTCSPRQPNPPRLHLIRPQPPLLPRPPISNSPPLLPEQPPSLTTIPTQLVTPHALSRSRRAAIPSSPPLQAIARRGASWKFHTTPASS